jgi:hypothetical protein
MPGAPAVDQPRACGWRTLADDPAGPVTNVPPGRRDRMRAGLPRPTVTAEDTP